MHRCKQVLGARLPELPLEWLPKSTVLDSIGVGVRAVLWGHMLNNLCFSAASKSAGKCTRVLSACA